MNSSRREETKLRRKGEGIRKEEFKMQKEGNEKTRAKEGGARTTKIPDSQRNRERRKKRRRKGKVQQSQKD